MATAIVTADAANVQAVLALTTAGSAGNIGDDDGPAAALSSVTTSRTPDLYTSKLKLDA